MVFDSRAGSVVGGPGFAGRLDRGGRDKPDGSGGRSRRGKLRRAEPERSHVHHSTHQAGNHPRSEEGGDLVNIELDILASYVRAAVKAVFTQGSGLTQEKLNGWGYS